MKLNTLHRRILTLGTLAAAILLTLPANASAQRGAGARGGMFNNPGIRMWNLIDEDVDKFTGQLTLTETQTESVNTLLEEFRKENADGLKRYAGLREKMEAARGGGGGGRGAMQGMMQEFRQVMETLGPVLEKLHKDFSELLDEEQTKKLAELLQPPRRPGG